MRRAIAVVGLLIGMQGARGAGPGTSQWVRPGAEGKLAYKTTERGDRIMDFSYAGYMGGGVAIPDVPVKVTVRPSGTGDDTAAIQRAIDQVSAMPVEGGFRGAVLLAPGTFHCSATITISADGLVLRGSGDGGTTIEMEGTPHLAIAVGKGGRRRGRAEGGDAAASAAVKTVIADAYVPSGTMSFNVADARGLSVGDWVAIRRPVTERWVKFMGMDDLVRDGKPQTWMKAGSVTVAERRVAEISGNRVTVDVPLADSYDATYLNPPGTEVVTIPPPGEVSQAGVEALHIKCPEQAINHTQAHFSAMRIDGQDCWARDVAIDETMNSVSTGGRRITLRNVSVRRKALHQGASKPAEFAPNATQVLLDRCSVEADNVWFVATGAGVSGPIVLLNCTFNGNGDAESHQRWSTGILYDDCRAEGGGIEIRNRGSMGSGHGWTLGWGVVWNCAAKKFVVQNPPGALNWLIGSEGEAARAARPFGRSPELPEGVVDSMGKPVAPRSLYLAQLKERLGDTAVRNTGYASTDLDVVADHR